MRSVVAVYVEDKNGNKRIWTFLYHEPNFSSYVVIDSIVRADEISIRKFILAGVLLNTSKVIY